MIWSESILESIYKYVTQLANAQRRLIEKFAKQKTYSGAQGKVIHYLFANKDHPVYQKNIERDFGMRPATATELVKSLEQMGLVRRIPDKNDGRYKEIVLTEKAQSLQEDVSRDMDELEKSMTEGIGEEELRLWADITVRMLDNLRGTEK